jgi:hypothetical protein
LTSLDFESGIPELVEPDPTIQSQEDEEEIEKKSGPGEGNPESESPSEAGGSERPHIPETPIPSDLEENDYRPRKYKAPNAL